MLKYLKAGYPCLWVQTYEQFRILKEAIPLLEGSYKIYIWDLMDGIQMWDKEKKKLVSVNANGPIKDGDSPLKPLEFLTNKDNTKCVLFASNFHKFINAVPVMQKIQNSVPILKSQKIGNHFIILAPTTDIPIELDRFFTIIDYPLPKRDSIENTIKIICNSTSPKQPTPEEPFMTTLVESAQGLTQFELENAMALSLVTDKKLSPEIIMDQKAQLVRKNSSLTLDRHDDTFETIGGLENLKDFARMTIRSPLARGLMLLGVPGTGKSSITKALGKETGLPTLSLDMARLFGSRVGESENKMKQALQVVDAMAPCILRVDEIEKGLSGAHSSHVSDAGTTARVVGSFLQWLQDHTSRVYTIATANEVRTIPTPFLRSERWDAIFFLDLPSPAERDQIFKIWSKFYDITPSKTNPVPDTFNLTGAEIKTMCRISKMCNSSLQEALQYVVPIYKIMDKEIAELREWAKQRAIPASKQEAEITKLAQDRKINLKFDA